MTRIKRKTFIIKRFTRITEQTYLQKNKILQRFSYQTVSRLFRKQRQVTEFLPIGTKRICIHCLSMFCMPKDAFSKEYFYNLKKSVMKVEKFKVLLYLKKSEPDKTGKAPIMGRITLNRTMAQFSCKLSCTPGLWNARESRLNGKSREAVETNEKIERLLLAVHSAFNSLMERKKDFDAAAVRDMFQGNADMQMTLLKLLDRHNEEMKARVGVDRAPTTMSTYVYTRRTLAEFIKTEFKVSDLVFGQTAQRAVHP